MLPPSRVRPISLHGRAGTSETAGDVETQTDTKGKAFEVVPRGRPGTEFYFEIRWASSRIFPQDKARQRSPSGLVTQSSGYWRRRVLLAT